MWEANRPIDWGKSFPFGTSKGNFTKRNKGTSSVSSGGIRSAQAHGWEIPSRKMKWRETEDDILHRHLTSTYTLRDIHTYMNKQTDEWQNKNKLQLQVTMSCLLCLRLGSYPHVLFFLPRLKGWPPPRINSAPCDDRIVKAQDCRWDFQASS